MSDAIRPDYYKKGGKEVFDMMIDIWGKDAFIAFCEMNNFKYRMRMGNKEGNSIEQELKKANWYEQKAKELRNEQSITKPNGK
jgi:hypothetical protein